MGELKIEEMSLPSLFDQARKIYLSASESGIDQIPVFLMRVVCLQIPLLYSLLLRQCGPFQMGDWLKWALVTVVQFGIGKCFYITAGRALLYGAVTGFWSPTYFETSAMLITFVLLGKYLETLAKGKTSDAMKKLVELTPATALLLVQDKGGKNIEEKEIDALLIQPGDNLKFFPVQRFL